MGGRCGSPVARIQSIHFSLRCALLQDAQDTRELMTKCQCQCAAGYAERERGEGRGARRDASHIESLQRSASAL